MKPKDLFLIIKKKKKIKNEIKIFKTKNFFFYILPTRDDIPNIETNIDEVTVSNPLS